MKKCPHCSSELQILPLSVGHVFICKNDDCIIRRSSAERIRYGEDRNGNAFELRELETQSFHGE